MPNLWSTNFIYDYIICRMDKKFETALTGGNNNNCGVCLVNPNKWNNPEIIRSGFGEGRTLGKY